jgi:hypothetical protein
MTEARATSWLIWITFTVAWMFVIGYTVLSARYGEPWWRSMMGWHVQSFVAVDAVIFSFLAAAHLWPALIPHSWFQWSYLSAIACMAVTIIWRIFIMVRLYRSESKA